MKNGLTRGQKYYRKYRKELLAKRKAKRDFRRELMNELKESTAYTYHVINAHKNDIIEPLSGNEGLKCSHFGCPQVLSLTEKLCGSRCLSHMGTPRKLYA